MKIFFLSVSVSVFEHLLNFHQCQLKVLEKTVKVIFSGEDPGFGQIRVRGSAPRTKEYNLKFN